jgi:hypothetical protein
MPDQPRVLWVDAICIDQFSVPDKNQQIPIMLEIYSRAAEVILWLGEVNTMTSRGFMLFRQEDRKEA